MDLHRIPEERPLPTEEELYSLHLLDLSIQEKYNCKYLTYLFDRENRTMYCLVEADCKEDCAALHDEAHGNIPSQIIEISGAEHIRIMGASPRLNTYDMLLTDEGDIDTGSRYILSVDIITSNKERGNFDNMLHQITHLHGQYQSKRRNTDNYLFHSIHHVFHAIEAIAKHLDDLPANSSEIRLALVNGVPVTENSNALFGNSISQTSMLTNFAPANTINMPSSISEMMVKLKMNYRAWLPLETRIISDTEFPQLMQLHDLIYSKYVGDNVDLDFIYRDLGASKSSVYRKVKKLTSASPIELIQEAKLRSAWEQIQQGENNLSSVAYANGFSSLSYFSRVFKKRFGFSPSGVD